MKNLFALMLCLCTAFSVLAQAPNANYDPDWDGAGNLGVSDLIGFLALFGDFDTDSDGIWDSVDECTDLSACNFDSNPTVPCSFDDAIGICGGWCESDENGDGVCDFSCGLDLIQYHGYSYATVQVGEQCWFAENLRTEYYANDDAIPGELTDSEWNSTTSGAVTVYGEGISNVNGGSDDEESNLADYGRLYNWYAVDDARGLCPTDWHVPTDAEWMTLEMELGMGESEANGEGWRGTDQGTQMKATYGWCCGGNGTNLSGFSALAGGSRYKTGTFIAEGNFGYFWSSSPNELFWAWARHLQSVDTRVQRDTDHRRSGFSVRCIKD